MSRETSPYIVGDYWLDKRRDGHSSYWQIATYKPGSRSVVYRSTKRRDLDDAIAVFRAADAQQRSKSTQDAEDAELLPHLFNYLREHGPDVARLDTIESSFRAWIGFLQQDELGTGVRVADLGKVAVTRFRRWRMAPHSWEVEWTTGKVYRHTSPGVSGEAVQRNIEDLRAALNHAEGERRITMLPRIPSVGKGLRSGPRTHTFTIKQLGAMVAYADHDAAVQQWLWLMIGTGVRPEAALAFDPAKQWHGGMIDLHPTDWLQTDKRNPVVLAIDPLQALLQTWTPSPPVLSRKRWWRTMRAKLGIPVTHVAKTIRHTVASHLRNTKVPGEQISGLLGHRDQTDSIERTSEGYSHLDPAKARELKRALTKFWHSVEAEADRWRADHLLTITKDNNKIIIAKNGKNV